MPLTKFDFQSLSGHLGHIVQVLCLCAFPLQAFAGGSIGVDYLNGQLFVEGLSGRVTDLDSEGPGVSLAWNISTDWSLYLSRSGNDGETSIQLQDPVVVDIFYNAESSTDTFGISYFGEAFWISLGASQTDNEQSLRGIAQTDGSLSLDVDDVQDSKAFNVEVGKDWNLGKWSPSLSLSLGHQTVDIERLETINTLNLITEQGLQEKLSGTDAGVAASVFYYHELSQSVLLAPSVGLFYQTNLNGEVSGLTSLSRSNAVRDSQISRNYSGELTSDDQTNANISVNLLVGDWVWSTGLLTSLSSDTTDDSWFLGLNYNF